MVDSMSLSMKLSAVEPLNMDCQVLGQTVMKSFTTMGGRFLMFGCVAEVHRSNIFHYNQTNKANGDICKE